MDGFECKQVSDLSAWVDAVLIKYKHQHQPKHLHQQQYLKSPNVYISKDILYIFIIQTSLCIYDIYLIYLVLG